MSLPEQEARALERARGFLLALSSGRHPARPIRDLRADARDIAKHYPADPGDRWLSEVSLNRCPFAVSPNRAEVSESATKQPRTSPNVDIAEMYANDDKSGPDVHKRCTEHVANTNTTVNPTLGSHK